ncbi:RDD family protein [Undibacterium sp. Ji42W]|uniref:RDD family protein n=1 Tax=Undibacterium sp. Ji42W TaxID=3413039 RepID=UPI003BF0605E
MNALLTPLHDSYASRETGDLLALGIKPDLAEHEYAAVESILSVRGVDINAFREHRQQYLKSAEQQKPADDKLAYMSHRLAAQLIDVIGIALLLAMVGLLITVALPNLFKQTNRAIMILWVLYLLFKDGFDGQSLGKRIMGIRVLQRDTEQPCNLTQSFVRNILALTVVDWLFALGGKRLRLGDMLAGTRVVKE